MSWLKTAQLGDCFRQAAQWAAFNDADLVHGMVTNVEGKRFWHGWCEKGGMVYDPVTGVGIKTKPMPVERFYQLMNAEVKARYPHDQVLRMCFKKRPGHPHGNWGPWVEDE